MRPTTMFARPCTLFLSLACLLAWASAARSEGVADLPEGSFEPRLVLAVEDGVPLRAEPGYLYKELNHVSRGAELMVDQRTGDWLHVRPQGWVLLEHVQMPERRAQGVLIEVTKTGARVRGGPGTTFPILRELDDGTRLRAVREGEWWVLQGGGHLYGSLAKLIPESGPSVSGGGQAEGRPRAAVPAAGGFSRWSFMDLQGVLFEVTRIDPRSGLEPALRQAMGETGVMESDWTFLRVAITVPSGPYRFNYSPARNSIHARTASGETYGNVYAKGPIERLPKGLREFFLPHVVLPGERYEGVLLFRPTLKMGDIGELSMKINSRLNRFFKG